MAFWVGKLFFDQATPDCKQWQHAKIADKSDSRRWNFAISDLDDAEIEPPSKDNEHQRRVGEPLAPRIHQFILM